MLLNRRKGRFITRGRVVIALLILAAVLHVYARKIEPRWIQVTRYDVQLNGLPSSLDGLKVVQLSDTHRNHKTPDSIIKKAVKLANRESPDIVVITGDFINKGIENAKPCAEMLSKLKAPKGVYAVMGNHDCWYGADKVTRALESKGIHVLTNKNHRIAPGLYVIGIDDVWTGHPDVNRAWSGVDENAGQILLSHSPLAMPLFRDKNCLALTGHTHGGQYTIPFIPRNKLPGLRGSPYISGWYREGNAQMYVNRGIGMAVVPVRFLCRPEVTVFTLRSRK
ncbi:MAG: metallophosphoesterase [Armatimonadota bacterium]